MSNTPLPTPKPKPTDWPDILWHTVPTFLVGGAMGFMAAYGYLNEEGALRHFFILSSVLGAIAFTLLWPRREQKQHGGHFGGKQSKLEGVVPMIAGPAAYIIFAAIFYNWPI